MSAPGTWYSCASLVFVVAAGLGCDAFAPVEQRIALRALLDTNDAPLDGAIVELAVARHVERAQSASSITAAEYFDEVLPDESQFRTVTDPAGRAEFELTWYVICPTFSFFGPSCAERQQDADITGQRYLVRITNDDAAEILELTIMPDARVSGDTFTLEIVSISSPIPVPELE
jgi:hypothetical protein